MITLDGSRGEGGGQIIRTAITLSAITGIPVTITNIRAGRETSGLRPQHVTAIQAAAELCRASLTGVQVGAGEIAFEPRRAAKPGSYDWNVGTAGAATLVIQTVLLPLALAGGESAIRVVGGTHVPFSPSGHYLRDVYLPMLLSMGLDVEIYLESLGWMPQGGGVISAQIRGGARPVGLTLLERGPLERIFGTAVGCNLPAHIPQRMTNRAINLLDQIDAPVDIRPHRAKGEGAGAGIFLAAEYTNGRGGFDSLGRKGIPSEVVAEKAITALLQFHDSRAAVDSHLADQLVVPLALAEGASAFSTTEITSHLRTNIDVVRAFTRRTFELNESRRTITIGS